MKASEIIKAFEAVPNFADDPTVNIRVITVDGEVNFTTDIDSVLPGANGTCDIVVKHNCPDPKMVKPLFYWNGKLLSDMNRDEIEAAFVMMLESKQSEPTKQAEKPEEKVPEKKS